MISATVNSVTTTFAYRGDGLRDSRSVSGGSSTTFTWDIAAGLPVVLDDGNQYLYGAGLAAQKQGGSWSFSGKDYLADGLGSTMSVVNASGAVQDSYTYDVYGTPTKTGSLSNEFNFAGQQTDGTGLQYLRARYYDPATGAFLSRDPLSAMPGWSQSNLGYAGASPANNIDPSGLCYEMGDPGDPWCREQKNPKNNVNPEFAPPHHASNPIINIPLVGEYLWKAFERTARSWSLYPGAMALIFANEASNNAFWDSVGQRLHSCAVDPACASIVSVNLAVIAAAAFALAPFMPVVWGPLGALAASWDAYVASVNFEVPILNGPAQTAPQCGYNGEVC